MFRNFLRNKKILTNVEIIQITTGFFGLLYSIILFIYYYTKINSYFALIFIFTFCAGIYLIISTKRGIMNDTIEERGQEKYPL